MPKLRAPGRNPIVLNPVRPSAAEEAWYRVRLRSLCDVMHRMTEAELTAAYPEVHTGTMTPQLSTTLGVMEEHWTKIFSEDAERIATEFVWRAVRHHDLSFSTELRSKGFDVERPITASVALDAKKQERKDFTIRFDISPEIQQKVKDRVIENVDLIKKIPKTYHEKIRRATEEAVLKGRELREYTDTLKELGAEDLRHASMIARDQNNKITGYVHQLRQQELGISKAKWSHTSYTLHPREEHLDFDDETYDVDEGHDFDDGFGPVIPGEAINCGCLSRSIIPGYDEEEA